jgi:hypothetical protein
VQLFAPTAPSRGEINQTGFVANVFPLRLLTRCQIIVKHFFLEVRGGQISQSLGHAGKGKNTHQNSKKESFLHIFSNLGCKITKKIVTLQTFS